MNDEESVEGLAATILLGRLMERLHAKGLLDREDFGHILKDSIAFCESHDDRRFGDAAGFIAVSFPQPPAKGGATDG